MHTATPKGRFAPTPSGRMHLGNVFAALLGWLSIKAQGGVMLLRIEDLDLVRTRPEHTLQLMEDLEWLGLTWEEGPRVGGKEGPYYQSRRGGFYAQKVEELKSKGLIYPCFCSRAQLHAANAPHAEDGSYVYSGECRRLTPAQVQQNSRLRPPALRLAVPNETVCFTDKCQGCYSENLAENCGDFIVQRSDGVYAYQLAAPADDGEMGVTEVVRGRDLLSSTPRQIWLLRSLGYTPPAYGHVPLLLAPNGRRLAKRDKDADFGYIRSRLPGPQPLIGMLAYMAGLLPSPRPVSARQLVPLFSWGKIPPHDITVQPTFFKKLEENI